MVDWPGLTRLASCSVHLAVPLLDNDIAGLALALGIVVVVLLDGDVGCASCLLRQFLDLGRLCLGLTRPLRPRVATSCNSRAFALTDLHVSVCLAAEAGIDHLALRDGHLP